MSRRWLLVLGSNLDGDRTLREGLSALSVLGVVEPLTAVVRTPARQGGGRYHNAIASLRCGLDEEALRVALKAIEARLGRVRDGRAEVALDIDPLAVDEGAGWREGAHARAKGELRRDPVPALLALAGVQVATA